MAMRPRGGGAAPRRTTSRPGGSQPVYETFKPASAWEQDDESHILKVNLPGFLKEQIKVSTEPNNIIRVRGERHDSSNKWSQFSENFQVPNNSKLNSVRAKFHLGTLTITVLKNHSNSNQKQPPPETKPAPNPTTKSSEIPKPSHDSTTKPGSDSNKKQPPSTSTAQNIPRDHVPIKTNNNLTTTTTGTQSSRNANNEVGETKQSQEVQELIDKQKKSVKKKELIEGESSKIQATAGKLEAREKRESYASMVTNKFKNAVKGASELDEDRKLLVNVGVAVIVIMAFTAYATFTFSSGKG